MAALSRSPTGTCLALIRRFFCPSSTCLSERRRVFVAIQEIKISFKCTKMQKAEMLHSSTRWKVPVILPLWKVWEFFPPCRALVYFQWYGFQAGNHIIKALHHIYSSSKVSDNLQLFPTPAAKPCINMNTLGSILIIWCILSSSWSILTGGKTLPCTVLYNNDANKYMNQLFTKPVRVRAEPHVLLTRWLSEHNLPLWQSAVAGKGFRSETRPKS